MTRTLALLLCIILSLYLFSYAEEPKDSIIAKTIIGDASWYYGFMIAGNHFFRNGHYAAMWGVPLGSRARVTNLANGKSIIVTIHDRGPNKRLVAKGRMIDLAAKAFYDLSGSFKTGLIKVRVEILK